MSKYFKYLSYVLRHKWFVFLECCKHGLLLPGLLHDLSKFRPSELFPYMNYFYGKRSKASDRISRFQDMRSNEDVDFDVAWLKHIHRNPHHWQYWTLREDDGPTKQLEMPTRFALEMVCDWLGAGRAQGYYIKSKPKQELQNWYEKNKHRMAIHRATRNIVEEMIFGSIIEVGEPKSVRRQKHSQDAHSHSG